MALVVDGLSAEQRRLVLSFASRSTTIAADAERRVAAVLAKAIRPSVPGASDFPDDVDLLQAVAHALNSSLPADRSLYEDAPAAESADQEIFGRHYLVSRLDDLVTARALDASAAERVRAVIVAELNAIRDARSRPADAFVRVAPPTLEATTPSGPSLADRVAAATSRFATEQTPSLLLYIGAFLIVVSAFIFVSVSGDQISDLVKLVLMVAGTSAFLGAGIVCHRYPRVLPAGRTFLVIGALIAPLDVAAYYVLVARVSPLDAPTLWTIGSVLCAALYAALRLFGYGVGYSYLFFAALLSAIFGGEALIRLPLAWASIPLAALALLIERFETRAPALVATLLAPLPRVTMGVAALAGAALVIPIWSNTVIDRAALPVDAALLTIYYALRSGNGHRWERVLATLGPGIVIGGSAYAAGAGVATLGLVSVLVGSAYLAHELFPALYRTVTTRAPWAAPELTWIGFALLVGGLLPIEAYSRSQAVAAVAFLVAATALMALSWDWDDRSGTLASLRSEHLVGAAVVAAVIGYRYAMAAASLPPLLQNTPIDLARSYAPLSLAAWLAAAVLLRMRPASARVVGGAAAILTLGVSLGSYGDAPVHTTVNALYAAGAAVVAIRMKDHRVLWVAAALAMLSAMGAARWSLVPAVWVPLFALAPAAIAFVGGYVPAARPMRGTLLQIGAAGSVYAAGQGIQLSSGVRPWDADVWRTTMVAVAAAGAFGGLEAWRRRSIELGVAAGAALPVLIGMALLMTHTTLVESLTVPFAVYGFVATWATRRSARADLNRASPLFEYAAATLAIAPTATRADDFGTLIASLVIAFGLLLAASRWRLVPTTNVALVVLFVLAITRVYVDPRIDEIRIVAGALLLALCAVSVRAPQRLRLPSLPAAELVASALIVVPTAVVALLAPTQSHFDVPIPLLLVIELAALYGVAVVYQRVVLLRAIIAVSCVAALEFVALSSYGQWYAALLGSAMINAALAIARRWPHGRTLREHAALGVVGVAILFLPSLGQVLSRPAFDGTTQVLAAGVGVALVAGLLGEAWITGAALAVVAIASTVVTRQPALLQIPSVATGFALMAIAIAFPRLRRRGLPVAFSSVFDLLGVWLYVLPTFLLTFTVDGVLQHAIFMAQLIVLTVSGLMFRRRWQILPAIAMLGTEALRGIFEVVNRVPSFATFAASGALLLATGFLLLLKRELFERSRRRFMRWWVAWLAASS